MLGHERELVQPGEDAAVRSAIGISQNGTSGSCPTPIRARVRGCLSPHRQAARLERGLRHSAGSGGVGLAATGVRRSVGRFPLNRVVAPVGVGPLLRDGQNCSPQVQNQTRALSPDQIISSDQTRCPSLFRVIHLWNIALIMGRAQRPGRRTRPKNISPRLRHHETLRTNRNANPKSQVSTSGIRSVTCPGACDRGVVGFLSSLNLRRDRGVRGRC
jgi:hypothetical protein